MRIIFNKDKEKVAEIQAALKKNEKYCPCKLEKIDENKCMCFEFLTGGLGMCHCGLYEKIEL